MLLAPGENLTDICIISSDTMLIYKARKFAKKQLGDTEARIIILQDSNSDSSTWIVVEFFKAAVEQLIQCQSVLKYTYTFTIDGVKSSISGIR